MLSDHINNYSMYSAKKPHKIIAIFPDHVSFLSGQYSTRLEAQNVVGTFDTHNVGYVILNLHEEVKYL